MKLFYYFEGVYTCKSWLQVVFKKSGFGFFGFSYQCSGVTMLSVLQMDEKKDDRSSGGSELIHRSAELGCHTKMGFGYCIKSQGKSFIPCSGMGLCRSVYSQEGNDIPQ